MKLVLCLAALLFPSASWAEDLLGDASDAYAVAGISADFQDGGGQERATITINQDDYIAAIPILQKMGVFNQTVSQTDVNISPFHTVGFAMAYFGSTAVEQAYKTHPTSDKVHFSEILVYNDDYGNKQQEEIASFDFTQKLYKKVNWTSFSPKNLPKISMNFKLTPFFVSKFREEPGY